MEAKNRNARSARNLSQTLLPVMPCQFQIEPQVLSYYCLLAICFGRRAEGAYVGKQTEGDHGSGEEQEVHGPVQEAGHEWQEEEE